MLVVASSVVPLVANKLGYINVDPQFEFTVTGNPDGCPNGPDGSTSTCYCQLQSAEGDDAELPSAAVHAD